MLKYRFITVGYPARTGGIERFSSRMSRQRVCEGHSHHSLILLDSSSSSSRGASHALMKRRRHFIPSLHRISSIGDTLEYPGKPSCAQMAAVEQTPCTRQHRPCRKLQYKDRCNRRMPHEEPISLSRCFLYALFDRVEACFFLRAEFWIDFSFLSREESALNPVRLL